MFRNAYNLVVNGGQFTNVENVSQDPTSTTLWQHVAHGAIFDSAERYPPGRCHPGTRQKMIDRITKWIDDPNPTEHILWLYGPAGSGKSALAHTVCERLRSDHPDRYGGSFFFARGTTDRGKGFRLFTTLACQLAVQFPSMREEINNALFRDPSLPTKSLEFQLSSLIIQPLLRCQSFPSHSPTLVIDGLDECADDQGDDTQSEIIRLISQSIVEHRVPLRFMIASRPEFWIRDAFETFPLPGITLALSLREDEDADKDIAAYLTDEFEKIRIENKRTMASVQPPWPSPNIIEHFVYQASGQYIFASTVLKFVGKSSRFSNPQEQLRILTTHDPLRASAFSTLDTLYGTILAAYPRRETMKRVLAGILANLNSTAIEIVLGVDRQEVILVLDALSPLIYCDWPVPPSETEALLEPIFGPLLPGQEDIRLCHLSFREFLEDETRSGQFYINLCDTYDEVLRGFFGIIHRNIEQGYDTDPHPSLNIGLATYRELMFSLAYKSLSNAPAYQLQAETVLTLVNGTSQRLLLLDPDRQINCFGYFKEDMEIIAFFLRGPYSSRLNEPVDGFNRGVSRFKQTASLIWKKVIQHLSSGERFEITPILSFLNEVTPERTLRIRELFVIPWHTIADILVTFRQHRHIVRIEYSHLFHEWSFYVQDLNDNLRFEFDVVIEEEGWRTRGEWRNQRILLAYRCLKELLSNGWQSRALFFCAANFFNSQNASDIVSKEYFQNSYNLYILELMSDISAWTNHRPEEENSEAFISFVTATLCWFNRQLTNLETLKLLNTHNQTLVPSMREIAKTIFDLWFLPKYRNSGYSSLYVSAQSIKIQVPVLYKGTYQVEEDPNIPWGGLFSKRYLYMFYDEVFGKATLTRKQQDSISSPIIDPLHWHPYVASRLLITVAHDVYISTDRSFWLNKTEEEMSKKNFAYLVKCLPYAQMTQQNLDSLRAIVYLYPGSERNWSIPVDFWTLSLEFLKKYDRSMLSEAEFALFERFLYSMAYPLSSP